MGGCKWEVVGDAGLHYRTNHQNAPHCASPGNADDEAVQGFLNAEEEHHSLEPVEGTAGSVVVDIGDGQDSVGGWEVHKSFDVACHRKEAVDALARVRTAAVVPVVALHMRAEMDLLHMMVESMRIADSAAAVIAAVVVAEHLGCRKKPHLVGKSSEGPALSSHLAGDYLKSNHSCSPSFVSAILLATAESKLTEDDPELPPNIPPKLPIKPLL